MVCRSVPGASVLLGLAKVESGLDDAQVQSLLHQLRHEYSQESLHDVGAEDRGVALQQWERFQRGVRYEVERHPRLRPQRREGMLARLAPAEAPLAAGNAYAMR